MRVCGIKLFNDSGDFLFPDFFLMLLEVFHGLLNVFLLVSVSVNDFVVFFLKDLELVLEFLNGFGIFLMFLNEKLIFVEIGFELT